MVEPVMYMAIGFLVSMLLGLMIFPLVHNRAERLTKKRLEAATPLSMAEIQADKDQLRAAFAMSARRLEMSVDQLKSKTTSLSAELGKKSDAINRMKIELGEKTAAIFSLEARERSVADQLKTTTAEIAGKSQSLLSTEQQLHDAHAERDRLQRDLDAIRQPAEGLQAAEQAENAMLRERINEIAAEVARLAMTLEGPNSPISTILAAEPAKSMQSAKSANGAAAGPAVHSTLAERIRAVQSEASGAAGGQPAPLPRRA